MLLKKKKISIGYTYYVCGIFAGYVFAIINVLAHQIYCRQISDKINLRTSYSIDPVQCIFFLFAFHLIFTLFLVRFLVFDQCLRQHYNVQLSFFFTELLTKYTAPNEKAIQNEILHRVSDYCGKPVTNCTLDACIEPLKWSFYHAFFFSFTVCSTVGKVFICIQ